MLTINPIKQRDWLLLALVLLCAAVVRFGQPGIVEFFHDDAMLSTLAQNMAAGEYFPVTGINSSVGIPNPPTSVYVMALPFFFDSNPMTAILFVMGLNVLGVGILWLIAQRYFGRTVALVAGLSYALSPWAALYSRKIWAQDFHTPFVLLGILLGLYGFWEAQRRSETEHPRWRLSSHEWAQIFTLPVLLFAFQIHFAAWALIPVYL
ncbi:MAG: glycosyltransferase family 39 protein, partial [Anaerolineae bacterium]|nr:glycosyltransferase family 39 protein [Anaerolineae bacterium]